MDETLIIQAQLKATGANIHRLKGCIGSYRSCFHLSTAEWLTDERRKFYADEIQRYATILRKFIATGQLD